MTDTRCQCEHCKQYRATHERAPQFLPDDFLQSTTTHTDGSWVTVMPPRCPPKPQANFEDGATRSETKPAYHLVPVEGIRLAAERMGLGWQIHGEENWKKGGPKFFAETKNHLAEHCLRYVNGDASDDHLSAVLANAAMLAWWEETGRVRWEARSESNGD
jgi:hypothetical protein